MKVNFLQGIANYPSENGIQSFLTNNGISVTLSADNGPIDVIFTHGNNNYLHTESATIINAWENLEPGIDRWLFWDINLLSATRTFGYTTVEPTYGPVFPSDPALNQHFFNTTTKKMYVYDNNFWNERLRVFAAKASYPAFIPMGSQYIVTASNSGSITPIPNNKPFSDTQVGLQILEQEAGRILVDRLGTPIKRLDGSFVTTEEDFFINGSTTTSLRLESNITYSTATTNIAPYHVVAITGHGKIGLATYNSVLTTAIAISLETIHKDQPGAICFQGKISNQDWDFPNAGAQLYVSDAGLLTDIDPITVDPVKYPDPRPPVARVIDRRTILFNQGLCVDYRIGGAGQSIDYNLIIEEVLKRMTPSGTTLTDLVIDGPATVNEKLTASYTATATFSDNTTQIVIPTWTIDPTLGTFNNTTGVLTPANVDADKIGDITASYTFGGTSKTATLSVTVTSVKLASIVINNSNTSLRENEQITWTATANFSDGTTLPNIVATWSADPAIGTINSTTGQFTAASITSDQVGDITASYTFEGVTQTVTRQITVANKELSSIAITSGPSSVNEGSTATYVATATFNDGTTQNNIVATWSVPVEGGTISSAGVFTAAAVDANTPVTITASYTVDGVVKTATKDINVINKTLSTIAIISGPTSINEGGTGTYVARATFSDGTTQNNIAADWSVPAALGTINASGVLTTAMVSADQAGNVTASYTFEGITKTATYSITVKNVIYIYYGVAPETQTVNQAFILGLTKRTADLANANGGMYGQYSWSAPGASDANWFAYPVSLGKSLFEDTAFPGFWADWEGLAPGATPYQISITEGSTQVPYYVYRSDATGTGSTTWNVKKNPA